jgi:hypothetical protein
MNSGLNLSPVIYSGSCLAQPQQNDGKIYLTDAFQGEQGQRRLGNLERDSLSETQSPGTAGERKDWALRISGGWSESELSTKDARRD